MKMFFLILPLFFVAQVTLATKSYAEVKVIIDGEIYTCSTGSNNTNNCTQIAKDYKDRFRRCCPDHLFDQNGLKCFLAVYKKAIENGEAPKFCTAFEDQCKWFCIEVSRLRNSSISQNDCNDICMGI